ncbi:MAG: formylglycine-generating enzyme family protein [Bryobacteraceae bacterium]
MKFRTALLAAALAATLPAEEPPPSKKIPGMAVVPAGEFLMGRTRETPDDKTGMRPLILRDDRPPHRVHLNAFYMDTHEVSHEAYAKFVKATGHRTPYHWLKGQLPQGKEKLPVYNVDWHDAAAYCGWAGKRLPTEAEWEKAARGGMEGKDFPWGDNVATGDARFNTADGAAPIGQYKPNAYGLFDMAGNAAEWCADWFDRTYYENSPERNPPGPMEGKYKMVRGGAWADGPRRITVFFRNWIRPNQTTPNLGFRCVLEVKPEDR